MGDTRGHRARLAGFMYTLEAFLYTPKALMDTPKLFLDTPTAFLDTLKAFLDTLLAQAWETPGLPEDPQDGLCNFHRKSICFPPLTFKPCAEQIWSRDAPESGLNRRHGRR